MKYFLYARKSTDDEERQILSIESQLAELREFAAKEKLEIVASLWEAKTAKEPGRTAFGEMLKRIESGEAGGILAWHPDRLARNSIDGGRIIYLVDTGKIQSLKFPAFWFEDTPQGKFMLNIAFGQSKYYVDNLSENVKRGLRQKLRRGEWPGLAPVGYFNELRNHTIRPDPMKHKLVKRIFELYATGEYTLYQLAALFITAGLTSNIKKTSTASTIYRLLKNPFYCGVFSYKGETYQGSHEPIISKKLFDQVQEVIASRGKRRQHKNHGFIFTGLMSCGTCGGSITAEKQKGHTYYRCTKKLGPCPEKYTREEDLLAQFKEVLQKVSLPDDWADNMLKELDKEQIESAQSLIALVRSLEAQKEGVAGKLGRLLDAHLEGVVDKESYLTKKAELINQQAVVSEKIGQIKNKGNNWLEPMREFILASSQAKKVASTGDSLEIRLFLKNIGSNLILKGKKFFFSAQTGWRLLAPSPQFCGWRGRRDSNP